MGTDDDPYFFPNQKRRKVDPPTSSGSNPARILAFTEACRTVPLPYPPPSAISSLSGSPSLSDVDTDIEEGDEPAPTASLIPDKTTDPVAHQQHLSSLIVRIQKLYVLANALPKESDRRTYAEELNQVGGLLAYKDPEGSPMARYLSQERREAVADQINAAVLYQTQRSAVSKLELQVRYTTTLWGWMHDMKHELPPQKKWPLGAHPPGNSSASATPTMEKSVVQGSQPVEQKEIVPPFNLEEFLDTKSQ